MSAPLFIGDELTAAGYRLAGARIRVTGDEDPAELLAWGRDQSPLVMVGADLAGRLPPETLEAALRSVTPLVVVVPDAGGAARPRDLAGWMREQLGVSA